MAQKWLIITDFTWRVSDCEELVARPECIIRCPYRCPSVQIKGGTRSSNSGCCILDSATVQGKGVSANADAVVVKRICILYRVLENQRSISAARRISCRSVSAAYNNGELLECQNTI